MTKQLSNNAYLIYIPDKEDKTKIEMRDESSSGYEPPEYGAIIDVVIAETPGKAKSEFLKDRYWKRMVYSDDWNRLRARLLSKNTPEKNGVLIYGMKSENLDDYWNRTHEILDHNNKPCDCPEEVIYDFGEVDISIA